jgi:ribonuclease VapC
MIVDSSALIAILEREPDASILSEALINAGAKLLGSPTFLETCLVAGRRRGFGAVSDVEDLVRLLEIKIVPFTEAASRIAIDAYYRFGKGRHAASLNFGDCMSYALAKTEMMPLLFKGEDFRLTDIEAAISA